MATETLTEEQKMALVPGIDFVDEPSGRCARLTGTGLTVAEVINAWRYCAGSIARLRDYFDWLPEAQLRTAVRYYELFPEEIDAQLALGDSYVEQARREGRIIYY
jgi:uncharacterized protein (DUF433 family)